MALGRAARDLSPWRPLDVRMPTELRSWLVGLRAKLSPISVAVIGERFDELVRNLGSAQRAYWTVASASPSWPDGGAATCGQTAASKC